MITQKTICNKENGHLIEFLEYIDGQLTTIEKYHPNGKLKYKKSPLHETYYNQDGRLHGPHRSYEEDGCLYTKQFYVNGRRHGTHFFYYKHEKSICSIENFYFGTRHGIEQRFRPNGTLSTEKIYTKDKLTSNIYFTKNGDKC